MPKKPSSKQEEINTAELPTMTIDEVGAQIMIDARFTEHDLQTRLSTANHMTASFEFEIRKSLVTSHKFQSEAEALYRKDIDTAYPVGQLDAMYDDLIASMKGRGCFRSWTGRQSFLERWRAYSEKMLAIWLEWVDFLEEAKFLEMVRMVLDDLPGDLEDDGECSSTL